MERKNIQLLGILLREDVLNNLLYSYNKKKPELLHRQKSNWCACMLIYISTNAIPHPYI